VIRYHNSDDTEPMD